MDAETFFFIWTTLLFGILWMSALVGARRRAERHLTAIIFADEQLGYENDGVRFLKLYRLGRHDIIERDFPTFKHFASVSEEFE